LLQRERVDIVTLDHAM